MTFYFACPCGGKLSQLVETKENSFLKCDRCREEFLLDDEKKPYIKLLIDKAERIKQYHLVGVSAIDNLIKLYGGE